MEQCHCDGTTRVTGSVEELDLRGLQCPGPIARLAQKAKDSGPQTRIRVQASDRGFGSDIRAWCSQGGHALEKMETDNGTFTAHIVLHANTPTELEITTPKTQQKTIVVFSGDLDRVLAAFVLANAAADMGDTVTLFFTFWGLNALRKTESPKVRKRAMDRMFTLMMPKGANKLKLSKMNMAGMGTAMMKKVMNDKGVDSLPTLIDNATRKGVRLIACSMSMDVMGLHKEELLTGVEVGGAATFLADASKSNATLFI